MGKYKLMITAVALGALGLGACGTPESSGSSSAASQGTGDGGAAATDAGAQAAQCIAAQRHAICSDAQVVAIAGAFNAGEIAVSQTVAARSQNQQVQAFANQMIADHTQVAMQTQALLQAAGVTPVESSMSTATEQLAQFQVLGLQSLSPTAQTQSSNGFSPAPLDDLDSAYLAQQILADTEAIGVLDLMLIPSAQSPQLQAGLIQSRVLIDAHLAAAIQLQTQLQGSCGTAQSAATDAGSSSDAGSSTPAADSGSGAAAQ